MSDEYVERFPGASMVGGFIVFCIFFGIAYFLDPTYADFNDEGGMFDFVVTVIGFIGLTFGNCFGAKKYGDG